MTPPPFALACADQVPTVTPPPREALLLAVNRLPASPHLLSQLDPLLANTESDVSDVTGLLRRDAALTARIIRIANSVVYNRGEPISSIEESLMRIGFAEVYRVTGFAILAQVSNQQIPLYDISGVQFRENSLLTALLMEAITKRMGLDSRTAYTVGLLRSAGKIALDRAMRADGRNNEIKPYSRGPLLEWENANFAMTNTDAAALVLEAWRFPMPIVAAVRDQYGGGAETSLLAQVLNLACGAAERCGHGLAGEFMYWEPTAERLAAAGMDEPMLGEATREALETFGPVRAAIA